MFQPNDSLLWAVEAGPSQITYEEKTILAFAECYKEG